jgi:hypothetical protein
MSIYADDARISAKFWCLIGQANLMCTWSVSRR